VSRRLNLLMIEDSEVDAELVSAELRRHGYELELQRVDDHEALRGALEARNWDLILCDHGLPSFSSGEALAVVQRSNLDAPFIILSGTIGEEATVDALRAGARSVILKTNLGRLGPVVERELEEAEERRRHRRAEHEMLRLAAIVASSHDVIVGLSMSGTITSWNASAERICGYRPDEVVGQRLSDLVAPSRRHEVAELISSALSGAETRQRGALLVTRERRRVEVELSVSPVRSPNGAIVGASAIARDVSDRRSLEAQLYQAQKMEAVALLAGGIAHDYNNLLTVVMGYAEHVLSRLEQEELRGDLEEIRVAAEHGSALTRKLLAFGRRQPLQPKLVDLNEVVEGIQPMLSRLIGEHIVLSCELDARLTSVRADATQLEQVILNFAVNARDAMPEGGRLVLATANAEYDRADLDRHGAGALEPGPYVELSVTDSGIGMDPVTCSQIFEPFFTTKSAERGSGLGLASVHGIVEQSGGLLRVRTSPGQGSTFSVSLPAVTAPAAPAGRKHVAEPAPGRAATILVTEDDPAIRSLLRSVLGAGGHEVIVAADGHEALELFERRASAIELLVTDVVMPGMGGVELAGEILSRRPSLPVLYMSGYNQQLIAGANFLQKPFSSAAFMTKVAELLAVEPAPPAG
jgi:two-component system cell cycle sensor histidine kinase/response regulator CckA